MAIVDHVNWHELDRLVEAQQRNREAHTPVISLFRWWARRPHAKDPVRGSFYQVL